MNVNWIEVGSRIRDLRKKNALTIERLSELLEVSTSFVGLIEKGESGISADNLLSLSQLFKVTVDYLLTGEDNPFLNKNKDRFEALETYLYDYTDEEIDFILEMAKFLKSKVHIKHNKNASAES